MKENKTNGEGDLYKKILYTFTERNNKMPLS